MAVIGWQNAVDGSWTDAGLWSTGTVPGSGDDAVISVSGSYTISLTASITVGAISITDVGATLAISDPGQTESVTGDFINLGSLTIDAGYAEGGSTLTIGGTLGNANVLQIGNNSGNSTGPTSVTAADLANTGSIVLYGDNANQATLNITAAAPALLNGYVDLDGNALLQFASGGITAIAVASELVLNGANARVADADSPDDNSALASLAANAGDLELHNGASIATDGDLANDGTINIDTGAEEGGSALTVNGTLTNDGSILIGNRIEELSSSTTVTVEDLASSGAVVLYGGTGTDTNQATLDITAGTAPAALASDLEVHGVALIEFASGGITSIGSSGSLVVDGADAFVADAASTDSNSALTGLSSNAGTFMIEDGASVAAGLTSNSGDFELQNGVTFTTPGDFDNTGSINIDTAGQVGGSALTVDGTLTNSGSIVIGNRVEQLSASTTVTVEDLASSGAVVLYGGTGADTNQAALDITAGTAPAALASDLEVHGVALIEFASGGITSIGSSGSLVVDGADAFVADAASTDSNSALTGLSSNAGTFMIEDGASVAAGLTSNSGDFELQNGVTFTTPGDFDNTGLINVDTAGQVGGSALTVDGTLTNSGSIVIGNRVEQLSASTTVTVEDLASSGAVVLYGGTGTDTNQATLDITAGTAPAALASDLEVHGVALIEFASGGITSIGSSGSLVVDGADAFVADAASTDSNSALTGLSSNAGTFMIEDGASVAAGLTSNSGDFELQNGVTFATPGDFDNTGLINVDTAGQVGGSALTVDGTLTNSGSIVIGNRVEQLSASTTVTVEDLASSGAVVLYGGTGTDTNQATLDITAGAAPATLTSDLEVHGVALAEFASGGIASISDDGSLVVDGADAFVADAASTDSNSALTGLSSNAGTFMIEDGASVAAGLTSNSGDFELQNGVTFTTPGDFDNTGLINVDTAGQVGGSALTVDGTLTNSGSIVIGNRVEQLSASTTVTVEDLASSGAVVLYGGTGTDTNQATLDITAGAAPATLTSDLEVHGVALAEFASGGIASISDDGSLVVDGADAFVADAGSTDSDSALTGLSSNAGTFEIEDEASVSASLASNSGDFELQNGVTFGTAGDFDNTGAVNIDTAGGAGGSALTVNGTLTNSGSIQIGDIIGGLSAATTVTAEDLVSSGAVVLYGGTGTGTDTNQAALDIADQVTDSGSISFSGDAILSAASLVIESGGSVEDGNVDVGSLSVESGGDLSGSGIASGLANDGTVTASGGDLDVTGDVTGSGQLAVGTNGTLELGGADSEAVSFAGTGGTLKLDAPSRFSGAINGIVAGDTIDLAGVTVTNAAIIGSSVVITTTGSQTFAYQISGTLAGNSFQIQSDGNGGSDLVLTSQTSQGQPYGSFYTAITALFTGLSDNVPSSQIATDAINVYIAAVSGAIGTIGNAAWQQAYTTSSIAAGTVSADIDAGQNGLTLLANTLGLYNTIIAGVAGSIAGGVSLDGYHNILQTSDALSTDIVNGAGSSQLHTDLANLFSTLAAAIPNAVDPSAWQSAQDASDQALDTLSTDIGDSAAASQILSDASSLYDTILSGSLGAIGGASLQASYAAGTQTLTGLGTDITDDASTGELQGDLGATYASVVSAVSNPTATSTAIGNFGSVTAAAETLLSQLNTGGTADLYNSASSLFSDVISTQPLSLSVLEEITAVTGSTILNWGSLGASLQPPSVDTADWNLILDRLSAQLGTTVQSLFTALSQAATTLTQIGEPPTDIGTLLDYEVEQASGTLPNIVLADTTDLASAGSGLDLSLTRAYSASLLNRNDAGVFGDGWTFTYAISAVTDASGNVYITSPSGTEVFTLQAGGTYAAQPGDASTLTMSDGTYVLTSIDGTIEQFLPNGQISTITDSVGDAIDISYGSSGVIGGVTSSNGQSLTFTTNSQGRITSATDQDGQQITYTYDASGDHLISVSGPDGVTSYSYDTNGNPLTQNALTQITNPDGTTDNFQYDSQGNLISQSGSNGAGEVAYSYPSLGTVIETNAAGNTDALIFDVNGNLAENTDSLGNVTQYQYDSAGELTGVVTPTGGTSTYSYDANGNLTGYTDADGGTVSATFVPGTDLLASLTDQDDNTTTYSYDSAGDLTGVTYDNGDGSNYQYSANGLLTSSTNALGQTTTYTYSSQGLLTLETFSDGTFQAYAYNSQGELISAQATNGGITTYGYNAVGELTSVTNPSGQVESYTYNSDGQELTRTEPDGSVTQYSYNAAGQLSEIQDGAGNLITQYTYNTEGQLTGSLDGNGQTTSYQYDSDGNVTQILTEAADGTVTSDLTYTYNADGLPIAATSSDGTWTYAYDADGQLTNAVFASTNPSIPDQNLTYEYDAAGNRTETIFNGAVNNYTTNGLNQYTASDGTTYDYDADGNLVSVTQNGATTNYTYNSQNQLTAVNGPNGNYTYQYDALGNVVSSTDNGVVSNYIIDPLAVSTSATGPLSAIAQVYNAADNATATYDYGNGLAAEITNAGTDYYNTDATGDVTSLSGADGELVDTYDYTPFGTLLASSVDVANPFQFAGSLGATTSPDGLVKMGARYYDPTTGRFVSRDPLGPADGANLYTYADNDPIDLTDPTGLNAILFAILGGLATGLANAGAEAVSESYSNNFNAANIEGAFIGGFIGGAVSVFNLKAGAFVTGAATSVAQNVLNHQAIDWKAAGLSGAANFLTRNLTIPGFPNLLKQKLRPLQGFYAGYPKPLFFGTLKKIPANVAANGVDKFSANVVGDVHLTTYDGLLYDFQAVGEFVLTQSTLPGDSFQVQARLEPWGGSSSVSVMTQIAAAVGTDRVTFELGRADTVWIDGSPSSLSQSNPTITLADGTVTELSPNTYQVTWNTGEELTVTDDGTYLNASIALGPNDGPGSVEGLLGPDEGQANDFQLANGTVLQQPLTTAELYGEYANAWRVTQATSLLDYASGETTATFTDLAFPENAISLADLPPNLVQEAEQLLAQLNDPPNAPSDPIDPGLEQAAILDYLATGDPSFLTSTLNLNQQGVTTTPATITSSTPTPIEAGVAAAQPSVTEPASGTTPVTFDVYLTNPETNDTTIDYAVSALGAGYVDAGAFGGVLPTGTVAIAAGSTSGQFEIDVPAGALGTDPSDVLEVQITAPNGEAIFAPTAQTTIVNSTAEPGPPPIPLLALLTNVGTFTQIGNAYTLDLGNVIQGEPLPQLDFSISNAATSPADSLDVAFGTLSGIGFNVSGDTQPAPIAAGQAYDGLSVGVDTGIYGANSETITIAPTDVNSSGYSASLSAMTLTLTDTVGAPAQATINSPTSITFPAVRVGTTETETVSVSNSAPAPAAALDVSLSPSGDATASGSVSLLAPRTIDATHLSVGINTSSGGLLSGVVVLNLDSDSGDGNTAPLPSQEIEVSGTVFREAVPDVTPAIFHVGDADTQVLTISNGAANDGYSENLIATLIGTSGSVTAGGTPGEIAPQGTSTAIDLGLPTGTAGTVGTVTLDFQSDGTGIDGFGPTDLGEQQIPITVDNYANASFEEISGGGTFAEAGSDYTLNLGTIVQGTSVAALDFGVINDVSGPADDLSGSFQSSTPGAFTLSGFDAFSGLTAGEADTALSVSLDTSATGTFTATVTLTPTGSNASGYSGALSDETLTVTADVMPCFHAGTRIKTSRGSVPVERLCVGDLVVTAEGEARPIVWIGNRRVDCTRHPKPKQVRPVRVRSGAFGPRLPRRDLLLSPDHAVFADDVLIPVKHLINGTTVLQEETPKVHYFHIELETHDVVLAEGLPVESYLDTGDRARFENGGPLLILHPNFATRGWNVANIWEACGYARLIVTGPELDAVRRRLAARAQITKANRPRNDRTATTSFSTGTRRAV